jgi:hypothetical protein
VTHGINQDIGRLHIFVDKPLLVQATESFRKADGDSQELWRFHPFLSEPIQSFTAMIFKHEGNLPAVLRKLQWPDRPFGIEIVPEGIFLAQLINRVDRWMS